MAAPQDRTEDDPSPCSICLGHLTSPVCTNCGHKFCANCILRHWQHGRWPNACRCPICRREVTLLMGGDEWNSPQNRHTYNQIADYNHRVSTTDSPGLLSMFRDIPAVSQYLFRDMLRLGGLPLSSRLCLLLVLMLAAGYLLSPIDFIPEVIFGVFGLVDDLLAVLLALMYDVLMYTRYIVGIGEGQR